MGVVWTFLLSSILSLLSPSLWETARYRLKYCLKGPLNPKQPTNQFIFGVSIKCWFSHGWLPLLLPHSMSVREWHMMVIICAVTELLHEKKCLRTGQYFPLLTGEKFISFSYLFRLANTFNKTPRNHAKESITYTVELQWL